MLKLTDLKIAVRSGKRDSFTLIELLTVMAIIAILAALILAAGNGVMAKASRSRASSEIQAMSSALEGYKTDNGIYPPTTGFTTNLYAGSDGTSTAYQTNSQTLYQALSGQTNFLDVHVAGSKSYMSFKINQLGNTSVTSDTASATTYIKDPWGYSYAYSTATNTTATPYNGVGFFDLWSTGGLVGGKQSNTSAWICNWQ